VAWVVSTFSAGPLELLRRSHERERDLLATPPCPARARARSLRFYVGRETREGVKGACHNAGNRLWEIMGHRVAEGLAKRFYPAFKREQQMPWHVRSTDASRRVGLGSPTRCDTTGDSDSEICIFEPRDDRRALLPNNVAERIATSVGSSEVDALHLCLSKPYARNQTNN